MYFDGKTLRRLREKSEELADVGRIEKDLPLLQTTVHDVIPSAWKQDS
jgi:hypothetical protein